MAMAQANKEFIQQKAFIQLATFLQKELCCPSAMMWRLALPTHYTLLRITASIKKDLL